MPVANPRETEQELTSEGQVLSTVFSYTGVLSLGSMAVATAGNGRYHQLYIYTGAHATSSTGAAMTTVGTLTLQWR